MNISILTKTNQEVPWKMSTSYYIGEQGLYTARAEIQYSRELYRMVSVSFVFRGSVLLTGYLIPLEVLQSRELQLVYEILITGYLKP